MPSFIIDGKPYQTEDGKNLLQTALSLGLDLPYFCWHPALDSVGACRQCAVKQYSNEKDTRGRIVMACMTPVTEGARFSIDDPEVREFRAAVAEWLMTNHPHDCPVCDEGGECHLQDMTVMTGHNYRRFRFQKRTFKNQDLGPFLNHEMNRCITCYRCVRFYQDIAGGTDLSAMAIHNAVYFGRHADGRLENEFSGNLVEVCPTGVFTDKTLKKHFTRKWDLQTAPSICHHCSLGCNIIPGERYGSLRRIRNRFNYDVNGYFLCDRGRYGYEFVNSEKRIRTPLLREEGTDKPRSVSVAEALERIHGLLKNREGIAGIGSPRASLESNFALRKLVGPDRFFDGVTPEESRLTAIAIDILRNGPVPAASLHDIESTDAIVILGEDLTNSAPMAALAVRQAARRKRKESAASAGISEWNDAAVREYSQEKPGPIFMLTPTATKLDDAAEHTYRADPGGLARLAFAIANKIDSGSPADPSGDSAGLAERIAEVLVTAAHPVIISGTSLLNQALIEAAANIAWSLHRRDKHPSLCTIVPECNTFGLGLFGARSLEDAFRISDEGKIETLFIMENDLYRRAPRERIDRLLQSAKHVVVLDSLDNDTTQKAELVLPASTFAEASGTIVNNEGRAQRYFSVFDPNKSIRESWRWISDMLTTEDHEPNPLNSLDAIGASLGAEIPVFNAVHQAAPDAGFRIDGQKIPRETHRYSGRTAMNAGTNIHEPKPPDDPDTPLSFSMEGYPGEPPPALGSFFWAPAWNSIQALNKYQTEVGGPLHGDTPGIRLIQPTDSRPPKYFTGIPGQSNTRLPEFLVLPIHCIFGSEELSNYSPGIVQSSPAPFVAMNRDDASAMHIEKGSMVEISIGATRLRVPADLRNDIPPGVAGMPVGFSLLPFMLLPARGTIAAGGTS